MIVVKKFIDNIGNVTAQEQAELKNGAGRRLRGKAEKRKAMLGKNTERNRLDIDGEIYNIPQFYINHVAVLDKQIAELQESLRSITEMYKNCQSWINEVHEVRALKERIKELEICCIDKANKLITASDKLHRRNLQIADLKKAVLEYQKECGCIVTDV